MAAHRLWRDVYWVHDPSFDQVVGHRVPGSRDKSCVKSTFYGVQHRERRVRRHGHWVDRDIWVCTEWANEVTGAVVDRSGPRRLGLRQNDNEKQQPLQFYYREELVYFSRWLVWAEEFFDRNLTWPEWKLIYAGHHVHHVDKYHRNSVWSNLQLLSDEEHRQQHYH
jgi:hypothetical protein